jgi:beta-xylosidase
MTLLLPVAWTADGWPVIPDDVRPWEPIRKPAGENVGHGLLLSDDFQLSRLGLQWRMWGEGASAGTFTAGNAELRVKARGKSVADAALLTCFPVDHAYEVEVEVTVPEGVTAGLLLHYDGGHFAGAAFEKGAALCYAQGREFDRVTRGAGVGFLRVRNVRHEVEIFWSADGKSWTKFGAGAEVSGYHHNAFGNWGTLKIGLFAAGRGTAIFRHFRYRGLEKRSAS